MKICSFLRGVAGLCLVVIVSSCDPCQPDGDIEASGHIAALDTDGAILIASEGLSQTGEGYDIIGQAGTILPQQFFGDNVAYTVLDDPTEALMVWNGLEAERWAFNPLLDGREIIFPITNGGDIVLFANADTTTIYSSNATGNLQFIANNRMVGQPIFYSQELSQFIYLTVDNGVAAISGEGALIGELVSLDGLVNDILSMSISPNGQYLVVCGSDTVVLVDLVSGSEVGNFTLSIANSNTEVYNGELSDIVVSDSGAIYYTDGNSISRVEGNGSTVIFSTDEFTILGMAPAQDENILYALISNEDNERTLVEFGAPENAQASINQIVLTDIQKVAIGSVIR